MAIQRKLKHVEGLDELDKMLDSLVDPKFRGRALRNAAKKTMRPVKETLESKLPDSGQEQHTYKHYESYTGKKGYKSGDLKKGVKLSITTNSDKKIKTSKSGKINGKQLSELHTVLTFDKHLIKLASILEHGRHNRLAKSRKKVFYYYGNKTDAIQRDIGTTTPKNFVSETFAEHESQIVKTFAKELTKTIERQAKAYQRKLKKEQNA
ncbi:hypothetical protein [Vibrio vulnificus]|uniref:hypothetical protein n=1 Tax=Vibrio vulnificus TaxID=672 RepID=UPI0032420398